MATYTMGNTGETLVTASTDDLVYGGSGADTLIGTGTAGVDVMYGNADADYFVFGASTGSVDMVKDFVHGTDKLVIDTSVLVSINKNTATSADLLVTASSDATNSGSHLLFETDTSILRYDIDGSFGVGSVALATLEGVSQLDWNDFVLI